VYGGVTAHPSSARGNQHLLALQKRLVFGVRRVLYQRPSDLDVHERVVERGLAVRPLRVAAPLRVGEFCHLLHRREGILRREQLPDAHTGVHVSMVDVARLHIDLDALIPDRVGAVALSRTRTSSVSRFRAESGQ